MQLRFQQGTLLLATMGIALTDDKGWCHNWRQLQMFVESIWAPNLLGCRSSGLCSRSHSTARINKSSLVTLDHLHSMVSRVYVRLTISEPIELNCSFTNSVPSWADTSLMLAWTHTTVPTEGYFFMRAMMFGSQEALDIHLGGVDRHTPYHRVPCDECGTGDGRRWLRCRFFIASGRKRF